MIKTDGWLRRTGLLISLAAAALTGGPVARAEDAPIKIGMAVAQSGWLAAYDAEGAKMAQLWIKQQNAKGGLLGRQIAFEIADTKTDRAEGAKAGQSLASGGANLLIVSADYDYGAPAALQAQKAGIISVFLAASDAKAGILGVGPLSYTTTTSGQLEAATIADWALTEKGFKTGYMLLDASIEYDKSVCSGYEWELARHGSKALSDLFKNDDPSISSQITRLQAAIRDKGVDHIMLCSHNPGAASAVRQIRAAGINLPIINGSGMDGTYWLNGVPNLTDFYVPVQALIGNDKSDDINKLTAAYKAEYGSTPTTSYAYPIYAWLQFWGRAVEAAGTTDAKAVVAKLDNFTNEPTVLGPRTYTPSLHIVNSAPLTITEIQDGKQIAVATWRLKQEIPSDVLYRIGK
jgi:branched-chain amino acid transport system substrate-binding protein